MSNPSEDNRVTKKFPFTKNDKDILAALGNAEGIEQTRAHKESEEFLKNNEKKPGITKSGIITAGTKMYYTVSYEKSDYAKALALKKKKSAKE